MGRLIYLDNLRSFALLLGIVFHSAIVYAADIQYAIQTQERSSILSYFCYWIHSFRMPMFYMISGFFSAMVVQKKGNKFYLDGRLRRVLVPTLFGLLFLAPIQYFLMEKSKRPSLDLVDFLIQFFTKEKFQHSHIWFLVDLFCFSMIYLVLHKWISQLAKGKFVHNFTYRFYLLFVICFLFVLGAHTQFGKGESYFGIFKLTFTYQFSFFIAGVFCYEWKGILIQTSSSRYKPIALFLWALVFSLLLKEYEINDPLWIYFSYANPWYRSFHIFLWVASPYIWTLFFVDVFVRFGNQDGKLGRYIIEASLPIYLVHHPISLVFAYFVKESSLPVWEKFILHNLVVLSLSFILYELFIQRTKPLRFLFGLKLG